MDESLPSRGSLVFEQSQFHICRISETGARLSRLSCQQTCLDRALQLDNLGMGQLRFSRDIVVSLGHAHTVRPPMPLATPTYDKSVDKSFAFSLCKAHRRRLRPAQPAYSVLCADTAGMQSFTASFQHHQL